MKFDLQSALAAIRSKVSPALAFLRAHRFWAECVAVTFLGIFAGFFVGENAQDRAVLLQREATRLQRVEAGMERWTSTLQPPIPAESVLWRQSEEALARLSVQAVTPLSVSRLLAERAEEIGIRDLGIRLASEDSVEVPLPVPAGRWEVRAGETALVAEFTGGWQSAISFLGVLPPQVEAAEMRVSPAGNGLFRARFLLLTRHVVPRE